MGPAGGSVGTALIISRGRRRGARYAWGGMWRHVLALVVRLLASALVLMLGVAWVTPGNPLNTVSRAVAVSVVLSLASYLTLARFLWFLLLPWLLYVGIWLVTMMGAYGLAFPTALLLALVLTLLHFLVSVLFGVRRL